MTETVAVGVSSPTGRMGAATRNLIKSRPGEWQLWELDANNPAERPAVWIDFSYPAFTRRILAYCLNWKCPLLVGTTGLGNVEDELREAAHQIPILVSPNMSFGIYLLNQIVGQIAKQLGSGVDVSLCEVHHRHKKDSPSGTTKQLMQTVAQARQESPSAIPWAAFRQGEILGEHCVRFVWGHEQLELTHTAYSREIWADGALKVARWLAYQQAGWYTMSDMVDQEKARHL